MKKQLLLGSALLAAISAFPQTGRTVHPGRAVDLSARVARKYQMINSNNRAVEATPFQAPAQSNAQLRAASTATAPSPTNLTTVWNAYTGSENVYGVLVSSSKPLQYNDELGRVSFVHRKSHTYQATPLPAATASTGVIVADVTNSWGQDWDSTCIWNDNSNWARYPNGGIYNPTGNLNPANAHVIGTGPVTGAASQWIGNWFASKQIDSLHGPNFTGTVATTAGANSGVGNMQFIANSSPFTGLGSKIDFARLAFSSTDDGKVRTLGTILNNANDVSTNAAYGHRGAKIVTGTYNASIHGFNWSSGANDSIIWPAHVHTTDNYKVLYGDPYMCWNESGTVGYIFQLGARNGATGANVGLQPIIYKTTNSGASWQGPYGIDFNNSNMFEVKRHLLATDNGLGADTIPWFNNGEDFDGIVDMNGKLHIFATVMQHAKSHQDSLFYVYPFVNSVDNETYSYGHVPGMRPYLYDFVGDGTTWNVITVDSMSSEAPGWSSSSDDGFGYNPWDIDATSSQKIQISSRLQMSRDKTGEHIIYTWTESDTTTTTGQVKWNISPDIKARMLTVGASTMTLHPTEINITDPSSGTPNFNVRGFAFNHYVSPKCALSSNSGPNGVAVVVPMTVSNNSSLHQLEPINHYYSSVVLNFDNIAGPITPPLAPDYKVGIHENALTSAKASVVYPNPAKGNATLAIDLKDNAKVSVSVMNMVGQEVKNTQAAAQVGSNNINIDLNGLSKGIYMVNVKVGNATSTKKLIVE